MRKRKSRVHDSPEEPKFKPSSVIPKNYYYLATHGKEPNNFKLQYRVVVLDGWREIVESGREVEDRRNGDERKKEDRV